MSEAIENDAKKIEGKKSMAMEAFAKGLRSLPATVADNAGLDSAEIVSQLRARINQNSDSPVGIDVYNRKIGNMKELGVTECLKVKEQALLSAHEACE